MAYTSIDNLYQNQKIMMFKQVWATEKIHGTSASITYDPVQKKLHFFPGGVPDVMSFTSQFNYDEIYNKASELWGDKKAILYGEHYGGKIMGMSATYGEQQRFVMFDVMVDGLWLSFDKVQSVGKKLNIDVVPGRIIDATVEAFDIERAKPSEQVVKYGITEPKKREGIVLKPLVEVKLNNGDRVIAKYKNDEFIETKTVHEVTEDELAKKQVVLTDAENVAEEWVTEMRLTHILDKLGNPKEDKDIPQVLKAMKEDIIKESKGETLMSNEAGKAISKRTATLYLERIKKKEG